MRLQILAAVGVDGDRSWTPPPVLPDSFLPGRAALDIAAGRDASAATARHLDIHPEDLTALWMQPAFWLQPVRGWIA